MAGAIPIGISRRSVVVRRTLRPTPARSDHGAASARGVKFRKTDALLADIGKTIAARGSAQRVAGLGRRRRKKIAPKDQKRDFLTKNETTFLRGRDGEGAKSCGSDCSPSSSQQ